ncbi:MAG: helix-turn-helix domain-containing protein [Candidatus Acidiferrales bacterium]|jgi:DNA-binding MarR family transcriptional regulator
MKNSPPRAIDYQALADFRFEIRRFLNLSERLAHGAGIEPQQHQALLAIKGLPPHRVATIGVLAERLLIQHHSAVELVNRLEAKGLLRRARGVADRREVVLTLSPRGETLLKQLTHPHHAALQSARPRLIAALAAAIDPDAATGHTRRKPRRERRGKERSAKQKHQTRQTKAARSRRRKLDRSKAS